MTEQPTLRQTLGPLHAYAAMIGILVGAGIFKVSDAYEVTGPSVVLGYLVLAPFVLAATVPYAAFQSTSLVRSTGGDYAHIRAVFGGGTVAFLAAWLKLISYLGALVYLALALAHYILELCGLPKDHDFLVATGCLVFFWAIHSLGVGWFGHVQVLMCALLGFSVLVLVVPGAFAIEAANMQPFFKNGGVGLLESLPILFFAYAGFESIAHNAAEFKDGRTTLPRVYLRGVVVTLLIFVSMSAVVVGTLEEPAMLASQAPMAAAAATFLPFGAAAIVTLGGVMAIATSVNATMAVPARLAITLAEDGHLPRWFTRIHPRTRVPALGLLVSLLVTLGLLWGGVHEFALRMAVFALISVYALHTVAFLHLRSRRPDLAGEIANRLSDRVQRGAAYVALFFLLLLIGTIAMGDLDAMLASARYASFEAWLAGVTAVELVIAWSLCGQTLRWLCQLRRAPAA